MLISCVKTREECGLTCSLSLSYSFEMGSLVEPGAGHFSWTEQPANSKGPLPYTLHSAGLIGTCIYLNLDP